LAAEIVSLILIGVEGFILGLEHGIEELYSRVFYPQIRIKKEE